MIAKAIDTSFERLLSENGFRLFTENPRCNFVHSDLLTTLALPSAIITRWLEI